MSRMCWAINIYPDDPAEAWIEFDSMINVRRGCPTRVSHRLTGTAASWPRKHCQPTRRRALEHRGHGRRQSRTVAMDDCVYPAGSVVPPMGWRELTVFAVR